MRTVPNFRLPKPQLVYVPNFKTCPRRGFHQHVRPRLSQYCVRIAGIEVKAGEDGKENSTSLLRRAGYLRQSQPGVFHLLPLGLRVQDKIERLVDKHMQSIGAAKISLSSLSLEKLWRQSGRLASAPVEKAPRRNEEFFQLRDRRGSPILLSPTHEEEATSLVGSVVKSYKDLPLRLYQVGRKYRDELRPRGGLLRGREFLMKDLYTFDLDEESATGTYNEVRQAYSSIFKDLKVPVLVGAADSGNMGGNISHEYHLANSNGEDRLIHCPSCSMTYNEEFVQRRVDYRQEELTGELVNTARTKQQEFLSETSGPGSTRWDGITKDGSGLITVFCSDDPDSVGRSRAINVYSVKAAFPEVDLGIEKVRERFEEIGKPASPSPLLGKSQTRYFLLDNRISASESKSLLADEIERTPTAVKKFILLTAENDQEALDLRSPRNGDQCSACGKDGLQVLKAIELGHTFYLGTRYTKSLDISVVGPPKVVAQEGSQKEKRIEPRLWPEMGCHGIGISRMIAAIADTMSDSQGLNWPRAIAPFDFVVIPTKETRDQAWEVVEKLTEQQSDKARFQEAVDGIVDDRDTSVRARIDEAVTIGFPVVVIVGNKWQEHQEVEVSCRRLDFRKDVSVMDLRSEVEKLLEQL